MNDFAHPSNRTLLFLALLLVCGFGLVGNMDYTDQKLIEAEKHEGAKLYSKRCEARGQQILAVKADSGKWVVHCVHASVKL